MGFTEKKRTCVFSGMSFFFCQIVPPFLHSGTLRMLPARCAKKLCMDDSGEYFMQLFHAIILCD